MATAVGGLPELLSGGAGFLVDSPDAGLLAGAIAAALWTIRARRGHVRTEDGCA